MKKYIDADVLRCWMKVILTGNDLYTPNGIEGFVESLPDAAVQKMRHGRWMPGKEIARDYIGDCLINIRYENWRCSKCNCIVEEYRKPTWNYCPNCGAKMDEEE